MMRVTIKKILAYFCIVFTSSLYAFTPIPTQTLLESYLQNNAEFKNLSLALQKALLSQKSTKLQNNFNIQLSTGTVTINNFTDSQNLKISFSPSVTANIPQASNLKLSATSDIRLQSKQANQETTLKLSVDIIGNSGKLRNILLLKQQRNVYEMQEKLRKQAIIAEKEFYTQYKNILDILKNISSSQNVLYEYELDLQTVVAKGFSENSSTYRLANMKVLNEKHKIQAYQRNLMHNITVFYNDCGYKVQFEEIFFDNIFESFLPNDIPSVMPLDIEEFEESLYTNLENALWTYKINQLERDSINVFNLQANGGYTFNNSNTNSDSVNVGLDSSFQGLVLGSSVEFPMMVNSSPAINFYATVNPTEFLTEKITKQQNELSEQQDLLSIQEAKKNYETQKVEFKQTEQDLKWEKTTYSESFEMYKTLSDDLENWYKNGIITQSEFLSAYSNMMSYKIQLIINDLDIIIYNSQLKTYFSQAMDGE